MLPLSEPNAVGLVLAHGNVITSNLNFFKNFCLCKNVVSSDLNFIWCLRECWWCHLCDEARCVRVWRWGIHLDKGPGRASSLCYSGLRRPAGRSGGKFSSRCQPDQVSSRNRQQFLILGKIVWRIRYYTRPIGFPFIMLILQKNWKVN